MTLPSHRLSQAYERSCALSDSAHGDDLPGLLCNWGCGLLAVAQMTHPAQVGGGTGGLCRGEELLVVTLFSPQL